MKKCANYSLFLALLLVLLTTACGAEQGATPTIVGTSLPGGPDLTSTPFGGAVTPGITETLVVGLETATTIGGLESPTAGVVTPGSDTQTPSVGTTSTPGIPVTGQDIVLVACQFCVDTRAHALLVLPDRASFQITSPAVSTTTTSDTQPTCTTVEINNGKQVVLCSGPEMTPLVVNICTDSSHCTDFPVDLLACPLTQGGSVSPAATQTAGTGGTGRAAATSTTTLGGVATGTATPLAGMTATATATP